MSAQELKNEKQREIYYPTVCGVPILQICFEPPENAHSKPALVGMFGDGTIRKLSPASGCWHVIWGRSCE